MVYVASLYAYLTTTLPIGVVVALIGGRAPRAWPWFMLACFCLEVAAIAWALFAHPLPNNRPEPNELAWLLFLASPFMILDDQRHALWWSLVEAVNVGFFLMIGALLIGHRRFLSFAVAVLVVLPMLLLLSIPPCTVPGGCY